MKRAVRLLLILILAPIFFALLLPSILLLELLMAIFSILAGRKWVGGIKWYTTTSRRDGMRKTARRHESVEITAPDSVYDIRCDVLNVTSMTDNDKKPPEKGGGVSAPS